MRTRILLAATVLAASCTAGTAGHGPGLGPDPGGGAIGAPAGDVATGGGNGGGGGAAAGVLTAGAWGDNENFSFYLGYLSASDADASLVQGLPSVPRADRMVISVVGADGKPYSGADVTVSAGGASVFHTTAGADGRVLFFPAWAGASGPLTIGAVAADGTSASVQAMAGDAGATVQLAGATSTLPAAVDIALVLDTTGSMSDELSYLTSEFEAITSAVQQRFPGVAQRWALVVYRDENMGDAYEVKSWDFTSDGAAMRTTLSQQSADGGGDYPELPDRGLASAAQLSWRPGNVARVLFLVGDAPCHPGRQQRFVDAVAALRGEGVHIYGVGASGIDDVAEYGFRTAAELSGGRYLFLTDDSGVGDPHKEPTLPCYLVTQLDQQIVRMIAMELSGTRIEPAPGDIIRTGGDPSDGRCQLGDGQVVSAL